MIRIKIQSVFVLCLLSATICKAQERVPSDAVSKIFDAANGRSRKALAGALDPQLKDDLYFRYSRLAEGNPKKDIALDLTLGGINDDRYSADLQRWASIAVKDRAPQIYSFDAAGKILQGAVNSGFRNWCTDAMESLPQCAEKRLVEYPRDVQRLALAAVKSAEPILRLGMVSENILVACYSASGLGILQQSDVIETIDQIASSLPADTRVVLASSLAEFDDVRAAVALAKYFPELGVRSGLRDQGLGGLRARLLQK